MRASFDGNLLQLRTKTSDRDGVKSSKPVADILVMSPNAKPETVEVSLSPDQSLSLKSGKVRVNAEIRAWAMNGSKGISISDAYIEELK